MHPGDDPQAVDWIGVDLNTTGHLAVVAHPASGGVVMLGRWPERVEEEELCADRCRRYSSTSTYKRILRRRARERSIQGDRNREVAGEVVKMARQLWCGIKLEDLRGAGFAGRKEPNAPLPLSRHEGSLYHLQKLIEARAQNAGVCVVYVDPAFTSRRCSRCGEPGVRRGKEFLCRRGGYAAHADGNAAFNIAAAPPSRA